MVRSSLRRPSAIRWKPGSRSRSVCAAAAVVATWRRDAHLGEGGAARELLDGVAIQVACREVHVRELAGTVQHLVDETHALEELGPVDIRHEPHARDDVAHRDVRGALALVFFLDQPLGADALRDELILEPGEGRRHLRILVAQPLHQLDGERGHQRLRAAHSRQRLRVHLLTVHAQQSVGDGVGTLACRAADDDALRDAPQVLDQHDAQGNRDRPQLADGQRFDFLVRAHETPQCLGLEAAVGVRHEGPGDAEHARETGEMSFRELGELAVKAGRQVLADLADLLLDDVVVVQHPLGGRGDAASLVDRAGDGAVRGQQYLLVVAQARVERAAEAGLARDRLGFGEAARVPLQPLEAEDLLAQDLLVVPMGTDREPLE